MTVRQESVDLTEQPPLLLRQLSHKYGEKPGPIDNKILSGDVAGSIKINLREGHSKNFQKKFCLSLYHENIFIYSLLFLTYIQLSSWNTFFSTFFR